MKKILIAGASLIALTSASTAADLSAAPVASAWDAFVSAGAGYTSIDTDYVTGDLDDVDAEIRATASYQFSNGFGIQSDVVFNHQEVGDEAYFDGANIANTDIAGHAFYRNETFLLGVLGQYGVTSPDLDTFPIDIDRTYFGGEVQGYFGDFTLYAQGGWQGQDATPFFDEDMDGFFINAEARYFATDNLKLAVNGGYDTMQVFTDFDVDTFKVGGSVEYRLDDNPLSVFAKVDYENGHLDVLDIEYSDVRVIAGLKLNFGTQTLLERDRAGATLDPVKPATFHSFFAAP